MKSDEVDAKILQALMNDGRASLRQIADRTSLTTPTVSARLSRMLKSGLIMKFIPVLSTDSIQRGVTALIAVTVESSAPEKVARTLARLKDVESVYMTTGQGITLKVRLESPRELQTFLSKNIPKSARITRSEIVTGTIKDEPPSVLPSQLVMDLKCDYCGGPVTSNRPYGMTSGYSRYYFCCKTCKKDYLDKYGRKLFKTSVATNHH